MSLVECFVNKTSSINLNVPYKSPRHTKKRRFSNSQAKCDSSDEDDVTGETLSYVDEGPTQVLSCNKIHSLKYQSNQCLNMKDKAIKNWTLKRSHTVPFMSAKCPQTLNASKSYDYIDKISEQFSENIFFNDKILPCSSSREGYLSSVINTCIENTACSRKSSLCTVRERNSSISSEFSFISVNELSEVEEFRKKVSSSTATWKQKHSRSRSDVILETSHLESAEKNEIFSLPNSFSEEKILQERKSIFEGGQVVGSTECFFPCPQQGQSITSFLSSNDFHISAELDRENAHFCISEALISAIEQMKFTQQVKTVIEEEESDEEIRRLTQRIRIRRRERQREKTQRSLKLSKQVLLSDGKTDTTSQSASPPLSSYSSSSEIESMGSEDEVADLELTGNNESNLIMIKEDGLSLSMASLFAESDLNQIRSHSKDNDSNKILDSDSNNFSAESVALSLLRKFSEKHLPKATDLQWIVTEQEAPQRLLPLPDSWPVSPDVIEEYYLGKTRLRGNFEWAPPRPQIISILLPNIKKREIFEKQKYKCAGCGMKIEKNYINRFRYCNYFGKYFCQCCHCNSMAYIPGRIIWKWNFSKYYVSKFAAELLDRMFSDPFFDVECTNVNLYAKVRLLDQCRFLRIQLYHLKDFINSCRYAGKIQNTLNSLRQYLMSEPHCYSIEDFLQVKSGVLLRHLRHIAGCCIEHIKQCILCQAKGFICEICKKDKDVIFKFQLDKVIQCLVCCSCFHKNCLRNSRCPRCLRIAEREKHLSLEKYDEEL